MALPLNESGVCREGKWSSPIIHFLMSIFSSAIVHSCITLTFWVANPTRQYSNSETFVLHDSLKQKYISFFYYLKFPETLINHDQINHKAWNSSPAFPSDLGILKICIKYSVMEQSTVLLSYNRKKKKKEKKLLFFFFFLKPTSLHLDVMLSTLIEINFIKKHLRYYYCLSSFCVIA